VRGHELNRVKFNEAILRELSALVQAYPHLRFTQILTMLDLDKDRFYEESDQTLRKIKEMVTKL